MLPALLAAISLIATWGLASTDARASLIGPIKPYTSLADSPFNGLPFSYFHLDTFEVGGLTPGVTASAGFVIGPGGAVDSVEGPGPLGHSFFSGSGAAGITFTFNGATLGGLPTHAGIVWTDGDGPNRTFRAFDQGGSSLGTLIDSTPLFFSTGGDGNVLNYRFFGATNPGGISSIFIANDSGGIEVDDLQFGLLGAPSAVPEPATLLLLGSSLAGLAGVSWRGHRRK